MHVQQEGTGSLDSGCIQRGVYAVGHYIIVQMTLHHNDVISWTLTVPALLVVGHSLLHKFCTTGYGQNQLVSHRGDLNNYIVVCKLLKIMQTTPLQLRLLQRAKELDQKQLLLQFRFQPLPGLG